MLWDMYAIFDNINNTTIGYDNLPYDPNVRMYSNTDEDLEVPVAIFSSINEAELIINHEDFQFSNCDIVSLVIL